MSLAFAAVIAGVLVVAYGWNEMSPEDYALRKDDTHTREAENGVRFTASSIPEMKAALPQNVAAGGPLLLWLGNSQLHTINQMSEGDHLAPYWLRRSLGPELAKPLGFSLPNANFQEHFVIASWAMNQSSPKLIVIGLVFDDLREDDLRGDFREILDGPLETTLTRSPIGRDLLQRFAAQSAEESESGEGKIDSELQTSLERRLTGVLWDWVPAWQKRPGLRGKVLGELYTARNALFGIKPTTKRRMIPARLRRNTEALEQLLGDTAARGIPVLAYIAPLRPDVPPPYDERQYARWKVEVEALVRSHGHSFVNLENLVPGAFWGTYQADDVDFMHFQGEGHKRLAAALAPDVKRLVGPAK